MNWLSRVAVGLFVGVQKLIADKSIYIPSDALGYVENIEIVGHRGSGCSETGCKSTVPENSVEGFLAALDNPYGLVVGRVELDVWLAADNQVVVVHGSDDFGHVLETIVRAAERDVDVENESFQDMLDSNKLLLKTPWAKLQKGSLAEALKEYSNMSYRDKLAERSLYIDNATVYNHNVQAPLLRDVLAAVCSHPQGYIQCELKGNKPQLGHYVLELAKLYPTCIKNISSFFWRAQSCELDPESPVMGPVTQHCPNGYKGYDILRPLVHNELNIPISLLFGLFGKQLPSPHKILALLHEFSSSEAHLSTITGLLPDPYYTDPNNIGTQLEHITLVLHSANAKVLVYTNGHGSDTTQEITNALNARVDSYCTNDLELVSKVLQEYLTLSNTKPYD